jgi:hypothetical protein
VSEREHPDPRPTDRTDAARDLARDLADIATQIGTFKGEANAWLSEPDYDALRLRLEIAHAAVEAAAVEASAAQRESLGPPRSAGAGARRAGHREAAGGRTEPVLVAADVRRTGGRLYGG